MVSVWVVELSVVEKDWFGKTDLNFGLTRCVLDFMDISIVTPEEIFLDYLRLLNVNLVY